MLSQHAPLATRFSYHLPAAPLAGGRQLPDEAQLVAAARRGDAEAYGSLVRKHQDRLCCSLRHMCGTIDDAHDAAQEAFLRAYLNLDRFTGASAFYTWLYRIAVNVVISARRRRRPHCSLEASAESSDRSEESDERLLREERVEQVQRALQTLTAEHRIILVLRELDDCNYDEIAGILCIPIGTVRSRLHRARLELRDRLTGINDQ